MKDFNEILQLARTKGPKIMAVAAAADLDVLKAVKTASLENIVKPILVGDSALIRAMAEEIYFDLSNVEIIDEKDAGEAARRAVELVSRKSADMLMKGLVDTSVILKAVLDKEIGLRAGRILSHAAVFAVKNYHKIFFVTDAAMNISPDLDAKVHILNNTVELAHSLGIEIPKVAVICAKEKISANMQATVDAGRLVEMNEAGEIKGCLIGGPLAFDNAVSREAAKHKGVDSQVAGDADIFLMPNIETGNVLYKALTYLADAENAGILLGARAPIVLTSRADTDAAKLNSIALAMLHV